MHNNIFCFGYSRKSPDDKIGTDTSIKNQNELIESICNSRNWNLISIESDKDISGGDRNRKGLNKQMHDSIQFKKTHPDSIVYILLKDSKRFARDSSYSIETLKHLESKGVGVFSIMKNAILDYTDISDRIIGVVDEQVIYDAKKYSKITQELKQSNGLPCIPAPFGYKYDKNKNWKIVKKNSRIVFGVVSNYLENINYKNTMKQFGITKGVYYRIIKNATSGLYSGNITYTSNGHTISYNGNYEHIISDQIFRKLSNYKGGKK